MTTGQTKEAAKQFNAQSLVEEAWAPDCGYVIAILDRDDATGSIFQLIDLAKELEMDGEIRLVTEFSYEGEKRAALHLESVERVQPPAL